MALTRVPAPLGRADAPRRAALGGPVLLLIAAAAAWTLGFGGSDAGNQTTVPSSQTFVAGAGVGLALRSGPAELRSVAREVISDGRSIHPSAKQYEGTTKRRYLERLRHRRWAAQSKYPRVFGYVEKWDDIKGEGLVMNQEKTQMYFVIRDEISKCYHKHKTLLRAEMVEFFATDEVDGVAQLPMARNITGPYGTYVKTSDEYRIRMLRVGNFPKRWEDTPEEYELKVGEYYRMPKYHNSDGVRKGK